MPAPKRSPRYRELLKKYPRAPAWTEALFFLADTLQESGRDPEAVAAARELTRRFPRSPWAPASHVFVGEHLFDAARLDEALKEYRAAAEVRRTTSIPTRSTRQPGAASTRTPSATR